MQSTLNSLSNGSIVRHKENWPKFLGRMSSESLTLVGFDQCDLEKIHDALEICSQSKLIQTVEVFIESAREFVERHCEPTPGLCLVKIPKCRVSESYRYALLAIAGAVDNPRLTMIPVMDAVTSIANMPRFIQDNSPFYISMNSEMSDFVSMFAAYLFDTETSAAELQVRRSSSRQVAATATAPSAKSSSTQAQTIKRSDPERTAQRQRKTVANT